MLRVLAVVNGLGTGGAERSLADSIIPLRRRGIEISVACFHRRDEGVHAEVEAAGAAVTVIGARSWPGRIAALRSVVERLRPDLVHTMLFDADITGRLACRRSGPPVLTSLVNTTYDPARRRDPNVRAHRLAAARAIDGLTARHLSDGFHALTDTVRDAAVHDLRIDPERVRVVPRGRSRRRIGVPSARRRTAARAQLGLDPVQPVLLNVGRQEYQKGQPSLIDALARIRYVHPDVVLLIAGRDGNASDEIAERIVALDLDAHVRLLGHADVGPPLAAADVFVFPSRFEGLGGAVLEAMAMEVPVVAGDIPVLREVLGDSARFAGPDDPDSIAAAVIADLADPGAARQRSSQARRRFDERYEFDHVMDQMADLLRFSADRRRPRRVVDRVDDALVRSPLAHASRAATRGHLMVLAYHGIDDQAAFAAQLDRLAEDRVFVDADQVRAAIDGEPLPGRATLITFDDGRRSVLEHAAPELSARAIPAMAFVVSGLIGTDHPFWWDEVAARAGAEVVTELKAIPNQERLERIAELAQLAGTRLRTTQLRPAEVRGLAAQGIEIGNHSLTHPCLDRCDDAEIVHEITRAHEQLSDLLGRAPRAFAYPNGNFDPRVERLLVHLGYDLGFLFDHRTVAVAGLQRLRISRLRMNEHLTPERLESILSGVHPAIHRVRTLLGAAG